MMCLQAWGFDVDEDQVNAVLGALPMKGASWENVLACLQHFGMRGTLVCPSSLKQVKGWTDAGVPVIIAWNPEGREWSHASVVFDVEEDGTVHVADPNIPDPDETVRIVPKDEFYRKWIEKWPRYLVRRPALAVEAEITSDGRQRFARRGRGPMKILELRGKIFVTHPLMEKILALSPYKTRMEGAWLVYTGLTQNDEIFFVDKGPLDDQKDDIGETPVYEVVQRSDTFDRLIRPLVQEYL